MIPTPIDREELARIIVRQMSDEAGGQRVNPLIREIGEGLFLTMARDMVASGASYLLVSRQKAILCFTCGSISHNPHDVEKHYCGKCHKFHEVTTD